MGGICTPSAPINLKVMSKHLSKRASFTVMEACAQPIAAAMLEGREIEPLARSMASLFFSDVLGFTQISSRLSAAKVSRMLNNLFKRLDGELPGVRLRNDISLK